MTYDSHARPSRRVRIDRVISMKDTKQKYTDYRVDTGPRARCSKCRRLFYAKALRNGLCADGCGGVA